MSHSRGSAWERVKFEDFAANEVQEYWIVDADSKWIEQYLLEDSEYRLALKSGAGMLNSRVISGLEFSIDSVFDEQKNLDTIRKLLSN